MQDRVGEEQPLRYTLDRPWPNQIELIGNYSKAGYMALIPCRLRAPGTPRPLSATIFKSIAEGKWHTNWLVGKPARMLIANRCKLLLNCIVLLNYFDIKALKGE